MHRLLETLARAAVRRRLVVVGVWAALLAAVAGAAVAWSGETRDDFSIAGTESFDALERVESEFPGAAGAAGQVVVAAPEGARLTGADLALVAGAVADLAGQPQVAVAADPSQTGLVSPDGRVAVVDVQYAVPAERLADGAEDRARDAFAGVAGAGLKVELGGYAYAPEVSPGYLGEVVGLAIAALVLVVTLGSLLAAGMPLLLALVGVGVGVGGITALTGVVDMSSTAPTLAVMLGLATGIDYSLFLLARHRQQLAGGLDPGESVVRAVRTAGEAVLVAGGTVVVALAGLSVVGIEFLTVMGLGGAATVAVAVLAALTLLPALMSLAGRRLAPRRPRRARGEASGTTAAAGGRGWAATVARRPWAVLTAGVALLGVLAIPVLDLRLGLPGDASAPEDSGERRAYELVAGSFGPGATGPLLVLVDAPGATGAGATGQAADEAAAAATALDGVAAAGPAVPGETLALLPVVPTTGPTDEATADLVDRIRDLGDRLEAEGGPALAVTGTTAVDIDITDRLTDALPLYLAVVVGLSLLLLLVLFRSVLVPLKAVAGFLLSLAATGGVVVAAVQWGWLGDLTGLEPGPVLSFLPILLVGIVFGLAMDYEIFLVSRIREEHEAGRGPREAVVAGTSAVARVVVAAALIMAAVFAGFVVDPDPTITAIGLGLGAGVLLDALVVRMALVPAALVLLGRAAWWWPGRGARTPRGGAPTAGGDVDAGPAGPAAVREEVGVR